MDIRFARFARFACNMVLFTAIISVLFLGCNNYEVDSSSLNSQDSSLSHNFVIEKVADQNTLIPGSLDTFGDFAITTKSLENGTIVFAGGPGDDCADSYIHCKRGVYKVDGNNISTVADNSSTIPETSKTFDFFRGMAIDQGVVYFIGAYERSSYSADYGVYRADASGLSKVVGPGDSLPGSSEALNYVSEVNADQGQVSFIAGRAGGVITSWGVYLYDGQSISKIAAAGDLLPGDYYRTFDSFSYLGQEGSEVTFVARDQSLKYAVYATVSGQLVQVVKRDDAMPENTDYFPTKRFTWFMNVALDGGEVLFNALGHDSQTNFQLSGIYRWDGTDTYMVVNEDTILPAESYQRAQGFGPMSVHDGKIAFGSYGYNPHKGIYLETNGNLVLVADDETPIPNGTGTFTRFGHIGLTLHGNQVLFIGYGENDQVGLYLATMSLCGDGQLDAGEECDDGNNADGDCCDAECRLEASGSACDQDGDHCTVEQCDGLGMCVFKQDLIPCCGDGTCHDVFEGCGTCSADCGACPGPCGNGTCDVGENAINCANDCGPTPDKCGDLYCDQSQEDCVSCPIDCGLCDPICGDQICEGTEDCLSCEADCMACPHPTCGNGTCNNDETCETCPADCGRCNARCGDGPCDPGENCISCPRDCGICETTCGNGTCDPGEHCVNCPLDCNNCAPKCGDGVCEVQEDCSSCEADCGPCIGGCGNGLCVGQEDCTTCPLDCGQCPTDCGNGTCQPGEDCESCPQDCGACVQGCGDDPVCQPGEHCVNCPGDCGQCPSDCGNGLCEGDENCEICPTDCGSCLGNCGNGQCKGQKNCVNCPADCGVCP
jgi:hypothetical protein